jgi:hypothetical protein
VINLRVKEKKRYFVLINCFEVHDLRFDKKDATTWTKQVLNNSAGSAVIYEAVPIKAFNTKIKLNEVMLRSSSPK